MPDAMEAAGQHVQQEAAHELIGAKRHPGLQQWLSESRLNSLFHPASRIRPDETEKMALMQRYRQAIKPAVARLSELTVTLA